MGGGEPSPLTPPPWPLLNSAPSDELICNRSQAFLCSPCGLSDGVMASLELLLFFTTHPPEFMNTGSTEHLVQAIKGHLPGKYTPAPRPPPHTHTQLGTRYMYQQLGLSRGGNCDIGTCPLRSQDGIYSQPLDVCLIRSLALRPQLCRKANRPWGSSLSLLPLC